jgi:hypothetical protein
LLGIVSIFLFVNKPLYILTSSVLHILISFACELG